MDAREEAYRAMFGDLKLIEQKELARGLHRCCAEPKTGPHHIGCHHYEPPQLELIDGQEALPL